MNQLQVIAVRSLLIVLAGLLACVLLRRKAASTRHLVYGGILFSLVLLPALMQWIPQKVVSVESLPPPIQFVASRLESAPNRALPVLGGRALSAKPSGAGLLVKAAGLAWVAGCLGLMFRLGWQLAALRGLIGSAVPLSSSERDKLIHPGIESCDIRVTPLLAVPSAAWMGRPVILLPATYQAWPIERTRSVVLHEAAHVTRCDWCVQLVGRLACALYWPNPLVWLVFRNTIDLAEQAADDLVLKAGVTPSCYAEDLLHIAGTVRRKGTALTTSMAMKNDIGRRIEMVLDKEKQRGAVRLGGLLIAGFGIAAATVPAASLLLRHKVTDPTSAYLDIHDGKAVAASASNGFEATLADGRTVELQQIGSRQPDGRYLAWRPDGSVIAPQDQMAIGLPSPDSWSRSAYEGYDTPGRTQFVYRISGDGGETPFVGLTSGPDASPDEGDVFDGGWTLADRRHGGQVAVCLMKGINILGSPRNRNPVTQVNVGEENAY